MTLLPSVTLSICIPTYNRMGLLEETLDSVLTQFEPSRAGRVEIVISDNASTDETTALVVRVRAAHPNIHWNYYRQPENKGADANILNAITLARGEFVYLVSDDDLLLPGALEKIFALIDAYPNAGTFCLNTRPFVLTLAEDTTPVFSLTQDRCLEDPNAALQFLGTWITFVSVLVFRRSLADGIDYSERIGSGFLQSYLFLDVLQKSSLLVVTAKPFLGVRGNNSGGYNFYEVFVTRFAALLAYAEAQGYGQAATQAVQARHLYSYLTPFTARLRLRTYGTFQPDFRDAAQRLLTVYGPRPFVLSVLLPLLFVPRGLLRGLHGVFRLLRGKAPIPYDSH
jgi:abequosyltransferase